MIDSLPGAIVRLVVDLTKKKRRQFPPEFKVDAVKLIRAGGPSIVQTARDLDLAETALPGGWFGRRWLKPERALEGR